MSVRELLERLRQIVPCELTLTVSESIQDHVPGRLWHMWSACVQDDKRVIWSEHMARSPEALIEAARARWPREGTAGLNTMGVGL